MYMKLSFFIKESEKAMDIWRKLWYTKATPIRKE